MIAIAAAAAAATAVTTTNDLRIYQSCHLTWS